MQVLLGCSLGGMGHLMPVVDVARALGDRGHDSVLLVPPSLADAAMEAGVAFRVGAGPPPGMVDAVWERVRAGPPEAVVGLIDREVFAHRCTEAMLGPAQKALDEVRPRMVVREPCEYATAVVAHRGGVPQLQVGISQSAIEYGVLADVADTVDRYEAGVAATIRAAPYLTSFPAALDPSPWPETHRFRLSRATAKLLPDWWPEDRRPLLYVTFGTVVGRQPEAEVAFRAVLDAVCDLPARVLMTVGRAVDPSGLGPIPANTHIERWVAQHDVFGQARLVVCHGGSGTTFGALAAGLPLVMCPFFADQTANAQLVAEAGAGLMLSVADRAPGGVQSLGPADVPALRDAIRLVLQDANYHRTASRLASEIARAPTLDQALDQILSRSLP